MNPVDAFPNRSSCCIHFSLALVRLYVNHTGLSLTLLCGTIARYYSANLFCSQSSHLQVPSPHWRRIWELVGRTVRSFKKTLGDANDMLIAREVYSFGTCLTTAMMMWRSAYRRVHRVLNTHVRRRNRGAAYYFESDCM